MKSTSRYLDLSHDGPILEKKFDQIINRIPDLFRPASFRLAGERDFFNETKNLKLKPFRKQEYFDSHIRNINEETINGTKISQYKRLHTAGDYSSLCAQGEQQQQQYPYDDPMPACMLADDNMDNLQRIIISSVDIEWRMLTPKRPDNEMELEYFDRLIALHRLKYRYRLSCGGASAYSIVAPISSSSSSNHKINLIDTYLSDHFNVDGLNRSPFRHTRHASASMMVTSPSLSSSSLSSQQQLYGRLKSSNTSGSSKDYLKRNSFVCFLGVRFGKRLRQVSNSQRQRNSSQTLDNHRLGQQMMIPKLTLTTIATASASTTGPGVSRRSEDLTSGGIQVEAQTRGSELITTVFNDDTDYDMLEGDNNELNDKSMVASVRPVENYSYEYFSRKSTTTTVSSGGGGFLANRMLDRPPPLLRRGVRQSKTSMTPNNTEEDERRLESMMADLLLVGPQVRADGEKSSSSDRGGAKVAAGGCAGGGGGKSCAANVNGGGPQPADRKRSSSKCRRRR